MENLFPFVIIPVAILTIFLMSFVFLIWYFREDKRLKRELRKSKGIRIADFQEGGYAKIVGRAVSTGETLVAPLSKRKCLAYQLVVEMKTGGKNNSWKTVIDETKSIDFLVHQDGETAYVAAKNTKLVLVKDTKEQSSFFKNMDGQMKAILEEKGIKTTGLFGIERSFRYKEGILDISEVVAVEGVGNWKKQEASPSVLRLSGRVGQKLKISDHPTTLTEGGIPQATLYIEDAALPKPPKQEQLKKPKLVLKEQPVEKYKQQERRYSK